MKKQLISIVASFVLVLLPQVMYSEDISIKDEKKNKKPAESTDESTGSAAGADASASAAGGGLCCPWTASR